MEQNIKPILWIKVKGATPEGLQLVNQQAKSVTKDEYHIIITNTEVGDEINLQVLSPYKDNGEIPEELLTWLKNQNDANQART